jgi:hypothetical protein
MLRTELTERLGLMDSESASIHRSGAAPLAPADYAGAANPV